ncbi:MAG TPA: sulfotransferase [Thermoleophilaceae bacterium]|nr:sulfotransferase [Thermoleophilaceae bacterium]
MLPNLLVIGGMKCGTTSFHHYLSLHPEIAMSRRKELNFFVAEPRPPLVSKATWRRGVDWYASRFPDEAPVRGESSIQYTAHPHIPGVPERAASVVPSARLIYIVRDPVERVISQYVHMVAAGLESRPLGAAIRTSRGEIEAEYLDRSRYGMQLERWLDHYPDEQLLVLSQEELLSRRLETLRRVFSFLGVDHTFESEEFGSHYRQRAEDKRRRLPAANRAEGLIVAGTRRLPAPVRRRLRDRGIPRRLRRAVVRALSRRLDPPVPEPSLRSRLEEALVDDVDRLRRLTGERFEDWSL